MRLPLGFILLCFCFIGYSSPLQGQSFQKVIGAADLDKARIIRPLPQGGFIIGGETARQGSNETDNLLLQVDEDGHVQWSKSYGGIERETINNLTLASDGGFLLAAEKYKKNASDGEFLQLIKTNAQGNMQWKKTFDEGGSELEGYSVVTLSDGGYLVSGLIKNLSVASSVFYTMKSEQQSLYILKTDQRGNKLWSGALTLGTEEKFAATALSSLELDDGSYLTAGYLIRRGKNESVPQKPVEDFGKKRMREILLLKNAKDGSLQWAKTFRGFENAAAYSMIRASNGDIVIAGLTIDMADQSTEAAVLRADVNGNVRWAKTYNVNGYQSVAEIEQTTDGNFVIAGLSRHDEAKKDDGFLFQIDGEGELQWAKSIGGTNTDLLTSLAVSGGWLYYTGASLSGPAQNLDILLGKVNSRGNIHCRGNDLNLEQRQVEVQANKLQSVQFKKLMFDDPSEAMRPQSSENVKQSEKPLQSKDYCQ